MGEDCLRRGNSGGYLGRRLAGDPDSRQGTGGDRLAAGDGGRDLIGGDHSLLESPRHGPVDHSGRERLHSWIRVGRRVPGRWGVFGRMVVAWVLTLPSAGIVGALCWFVANGIGGALGVIVVSGILVASAAYMFLRSRRTAITPDNVNAEWEGGLAPAPAPDRVEIVS